MMRIGFDVQPSALAAAPSQSGPCNPMMSAASARNRAVRMRVVPLCINVCRSVVPVAPFAGRDAA
jgi:hypothetical protein